MKVLVTNYTFDASLKTITFNDYGSIVQDSILLITNVTDNVIIYNFASPSLGGTVATNVLTLTYDTTSMADTDALQIFYEDPAQDFTNDATNGTLVNLGTNNDVTVASLPLPTGAATAALQTQPGVDIGDVTINNASGAGAVNIQDGGNTITVDGTVVVTDGAGSLTVDNSTLSVVGGGVEATALRVTIANDSTGVVSIDDNGGSVTVDGTVSVTGVATAANQSTEITALQLLDDVVATDGAAALTKLYQVGGTDGTNSQILSTNTSGHVNIADGGNSITVDGTVTASAQPGVDIGDVTINNASGASAVNIQDGGNSITVDYATTGSGTATGALRVELPTNGTGVVGLNTGSNTVGSIASITTSVVPGTGATNLGKAVDSAAGATDTGIAPLVVRDDALTTLTPVDGDYVNERANARGALWVSIEDGAGGQITSFGGGTQFAEDAAHSSGATGTLALGVRRDTPTTMTSADGDYHASTFDANGAQWVSLATKLDATNDTVGIGPQTTGGLTTYHLVSAATTNATNIKASAGQLYGWYIYNSNASARKVAFHNSASAPTAGASVFFSIVIPANSGANVFSPIGIAFSSGIGITTVTGLADSDSAAVAANDLIINLFYK